MPTELPHTPESPSPVRGEADAPIFSQLAGDPDMVELVEMFVSELPQRMSTMLDSWQNHDLREMRRLAHQLKGSSGGYGFSQLGRAAAHLELQLTSQIDHGEEQDLAAIKQSVDELVRLCGRVRTK